MALINHFALLFREEMGSPPMEYLVRVQAAIFVLRESVTRSAPSLAASGSMTARIWR